MAKSKIWTTIALALMMSFAFIASVSAAVGNTLPAHVVEVSINGDDITNDETTRTFMDRDNMLNIKVKLKSEENASLNDVEITAFISGYDYNYNTDERLSDTTRPFNVESDVEYTKTLKIQLPELLKKGNYKLRIIMADAYGAVQTYAYNLNIEPNGPQMSIRDVLFSPDNEVIAGRALLATVRIKNVGETTQEGIKVKVAVPELGISASQYIDELEDGKSISSEELYMRIPACAKAGTYNADVTLTYDEGHAQVTKKGAIFVVADSACKLASAKETEKEQPKPSEQVVVSVGPASQTLTRGEGGAIYQMTLENKGSVAKTYVLSVEGADAWAVTRISPSGIVSLNANEQKSVYVYVTGKESATAGTHMFSVSLKEGENVLKQIPFSAEVVDANNSADVLTRSLEIGLIVLLFLVVIAALIVVFNRLRGKKEETELAQTYY